MLNLKDLLALFRKIYLFSPHAPLLVNCTNALRPDFPDNSEMAIGLGIQVGQAFLPAL